MECRLTDAVEKLKKLKKMVRDVGFEPTTTSALLPV